MHLKCLARKKRENKGRKTEMTHLYLLRMVFAVPSVTIRLFSPGEMKHAAMERAQAHEMPHDVGVR